MCMLALKNSNLYLNIFHCKLNSCFAFYIFSDQQSRWRGGKTSGHSDKVELKMPNAIPSETLSHYSPLTGLIYIFNLIVGTGALTLPAAFHDAGWLLRYEKLFKRSKSIFTGFQKGF